MIKKATSVAFLFTMGSKAYIIQPRGEMLQWKNMNITLISQKKMEQNM